MNIKKKLLLKYVLFAEPAFLNFYGFKYYKYKKQNIGQQYFYEYGDVYTFYTRIVYPHLSIPYPYLTL